MDSCGAPEKAGRIGPGKRPHTRERPGTRRCRHHTAREGTRPVGRIWRIPRLPPPPTGPVSADVHPRPAAPPASPRPGAGAGATTAPGAFAPPPATADSTPTVVEPFVARPRRRQILSEIGSANLRSVNSSRSSIGCRQPNSSGPDMCRQPGRASHAHHAHPSRHRTLRDHSNDGTTRGQTLDAAGGPTQAWGATGRCRPARCRGRLVATHGTGERITCSRAAHSDCLPPRHAETTATPNPDAEHKGRTAPIRPSRTTYIAVSVVDLGVFNPAPRSPPRPPDQDHLVERSSGTPAADTRLREHLHSPAPWE
jgi:hypothetical protein